MAAQIQTQLIGQARQSWQSAADMMPQLICLLDGNGHLVHTNRTLERWGLGKVAAARGAHLHDVLHRDCVDPHCYIRLLKLTSTSKLSRRARTECEVFDPVLKRHLTVLVKYLARPRRQFWTVEDPNAVVILSDVSEFRPAGAGHQRPYDGLERRACDENERRQLSEEMQARLLGILEQTTDYTAMRDPAGSMDSINRAGRATSRMKAGIRDEAIPSAVCNGPWTVKPGPRDRPGHEMDGSRVIRARRGNDRRVENPSAMVRDAKAQVQLAQSLRESHDELRRLSGLLVAIQEGERRRIAMDLHDGLGQSLSLIKLSIESAVRLLATGETAEAGESLQQLIPRVREALGEVRRVSTELRPWILDDLGIVRTLSWFFREFEAARGDITVEQAINVAEHEVPVPLQITIFRVLQEATNNILKHAGANRVRVRLDRIDDVISLLIEDNGCGFNPDCVRGVDGQCSGLGLLSMKERAAFSGGTYQISSSPGQGTRIQVWWPCG